MLAPAQSHARCVHGARRVQTKSRTVTWDHAWSLYRMRRAPVMHRRFPTLRAAHCVCLDPFDTVELAVGSIASPVLQPPSCLRHHSSRCGLRPCCRANPLAESPLPFHAANASRPARSVHRRPPNPVHLVACPDLEPRLPIASACSCANPDFIWASSGSKSDILRRFDRRHRTHQHCPFPSRRVASSP
jgi:hypothetical protein